MLISTMITSLVRNSTHNLVLLVTIFVCAIGYFNQPVAGVETVPFCPFYNNRGVSPQPFLKNCTWYKDNACCQQIEIEYGFANVKPPQGASPKCLQQLNFLMCYICDPTQYKFYRNEYLTVCSEFCDNFYDACKDATLKGSVISKLYKSGHDFCESRGFKVKSQDGTGGCFYYDDDSPSGVARFSSSMSSCLMALLSSITLMKSIWH